MRDAKSKIRFIETFAIATFPIALAAGCSATGGKTAELSMQVTPAVEQQAELRASELNSVAYLDSEATLDQPTASPGHEPEADTAQSIETLDTAGKGFSTDTANVLQVNLQPHQDSKKEKPQTGIFHFAFNRHDVAEQDLAIIKQHADYLQENTEVVVSVNGYADSRGSEGNNFIVSKKRARQVAEILVSYGVPQSQIKVNGYGESFPQDNKKDWDENRRVELIYPDEMETRGLITRAF